MRLIICGIHDRLIPTIIYMLIISLYLFYRLGYAIKHLHGKHTFIVVIFTTLDGNNQRSPWNIIATYMQSFQDIYIYATIQYFVKSSNACRQLRQAFFINACSIHKSLNLENYKTGYLAPSPKRIS